MRLIVIFLILSFKCVAQNDSLYKYRTLKDTFEVVDINCNENTAYTIYVKSESNGLYYKIISKRSDNNFEKGKYVKIKKNRLYNLELKSYFNISKKIGEVYYPISSSNYTKCVSISNTLQACIEDKENLDKDVFFVSELLGLYLKK